MKNMIKYTTTGKNFKGMVATLQALLDECRITISPTGIDVKMVDSTNVGIILLELPKQIFSQWEVNEAKVFGLELSRVAQATNKKNLNNKDSIGVTITTEMVEKYSHKARVKTEPLRDGERQEYKDVYITAPKDTMILSIDGFRRSINLMNEAEVRKAPKIPEVPFCAEITMSAARFKKIINRAKAVSDYIVFKVETVGDVLFFYTEAESTKFSDDKEESESSISNGCKVTATKDKVKSLYGLDHLHSIAQTIDSKAQIRIKFASDYPVSVEFPICGCELDGKNELGGKGTLLLAPRIESE